MIRYQTCRNHFLRKRNFDAEILSVEDEIYSQKWSDERNFIHRQSKTLDLLFAALPPGSLFFPGNCLSSRPHSSLLPVAHGIMGIIAWIVFNLPMIPYVLCLRQESEAWGRHSYFSHFLAGLTYSVERLTAEREVAGSILGARAILRVLEKLKDESTPFTAPAARPSRGSDDHVKWRSSFP